MADSTVSARGRTTVPVEVRQAVGAEPGTRLVWRVLSGSRLAILIKNEAAKDVVGLAKIPPKTSRGICKYR